METETDKDAALTSRGSPYEGGKRMHRPINVVMLCGVMRNLRKPREVRLACRESFRSDFAGNRGARTSLWKDLQLG